MTATICLALALRLVGSALVAVLWSTIAGAMKRRPYASQPTREDPNR